MEKIPRTENIDSVFNRSGNIEAKIGDTDIKLEYASPDIKYLFKSIFERKNIFDQNIKKLDVLKNLRKIDNFTLQNSTNRYSIKDILPPDWEVYFLNKKSREFVSGLDFKKKNIILNENPLEVEGILSLVHEMGHYEEYEILSEEEKKERTDARRRDGFFGIVHQKDKDLIIKEERNAWAYGLNHLRHFKKDLDISSEEIEKKVHNDCLQHYEDNIDTYEGLDYNKNVNPRTEELPIVSQKQEIKIDFATSTKEKLVDNMDFSIEENQDYLPDQREQFKKKIKEALNLALEIHKDQKPRPDGPYVNHIVRVSNRIVEEYGIKDPELVIAAALHDSVEDQAEKLAPLVNSTELVSIREKALLFIKNTFGERVEKIVSKLSNPEPESEGLTPEQKNSIYKEHVKEAIEDSDVFPIKLADFSDNALNLEAVGYPTKRLKLSKKYLPVMEVFIDRIDRAQDILSPEKIVEMRNRLLSAMESTKTFIQNQEIKNLEKEGEEEKITKAREDILKKFE